MDHGPNRTCNTHDLRNRRDWSRNRTTDHAAASPRPPGNTSRYLRHQSDGASSICSVLLTSAGLDYNEAWRADAGEFYRTAASTVVWLYNVCRDSALLYFPWDQRLWPGVTSAGPRECISHVHAVRSYLGWRRPGAAVEPLPNSRQKGEVTMRKDDFS